MTHPDIAAKNVELATAFEAMRALEREMFDEISAARRKVEDAYADRLNAAGEAYRRAMGALKSTEIKVAVQGLSIEQRGKKIADDPMFSIRAKHCFASAGIETFGDLATRTRTQLLAIKNFGLKTLNETREVMALHGSQLAE